MRPLLVLQHNHDVPLGYLGDVLDERGAAYEIRPLYDGATVPGHSPWGAIVVLGGSMGAYEESEHPYLADEKQLLRDAVGADLPVLGICLGCQLIADALGGKAYLASSPEVSFDTIELLPAAAGEPVVSAMSDPVLSFHQDTWEPPPGATLLARSDRFPHAFRIGSALGIQPHPETTPEMLEIWLTDHDVAAMLRANEIEGPELLAEVEAGRSRSESMARRMFGIWLDAIGAVAPHGVGQTSR